MKITRKELKKLISEMFIGQEDSLPVEIPIKAGLNSREDSRFNPVPAGRGEAIMVQGFFDNLITLDQKIKEIDVKTAQDEKMRQAGTYQSGIGYESNQREDLIKDAILDIFNLDLEELKTSVEKFLDYTNKLRALYNSQDAENVSLAAELVNRLNYLPRDITDLAVEDAEAQSIIDQFEFDYEQDRLGKKPNPGVKDAVKSARLEAIHKKNRKDHRLKNEDFMKYLDRKITSEYSKNKSSFRLAVLAYMLKPDYVASTEPIFFDNDGDLVQFIVERFDSMFRNINRDIEIDINSKFNLRGIERTSYGRTGILFRGVALNKLFKTVKTRLVEQTINDLVVDGTLVIKRSEEGYYPQVDEIGISDKEYDYLRDHDPDFEWIRKYDGKANRRMSESKKKKRKKKKSKKHHYLYPYVYGLDRNEIENDTSDFNFDASGNGDGGE